MELREQLEQELRNTTRRLRHVGEAVMLEECPEGVSGPVTDLLDEIEIIESRERLLAIRGRLADRVNRLSEALTRLRDGRYGICEECDQPIAPARLRAIPEARACVRCQSRLERHARRQRESEEWRGGSEFGWDA